MKTLFLKCLTETVATSRMQTLAETLADPFKSMQKNYDGDFFSIHACVYGGEASGYAQLQCVAVCCSMLQCVAVCCSLASRDSDLLCTVVWGGYS